MLNAGISEDVIIERIRKSGQSFDLSPEQMVALKKAKASDNLMKAMMESGAGTSSTAAPAAAAAATSTAASGQTPSQAGATPAVSSQAAGSAPAQPKKKGFFGSIGGSVMDGATGKSVIDKVGLRNVLPQLDPNKPVSDQWPHVAITVL